MYYLYVQNIQIINNMTAVPLLIVYLSERVLVFYYLHIKIKKKKKCK